MNVLYASLFPTPVVEKPVENVEKSTVSTGVIKNLPVFPHKKSYAPFMHKVRFFLFFLNYVATQFSLFFDEIFLKNSVFGDLIKNRRFVFPFDAKFFVDFSQKFQLYDFSGTGHNIR